MENKEITFEELQNNTLYLHAKLDQEYTGIAKQGIPVMDPYRGYSLCLRLIRELFFRLRLPFRSLFYNAEVGEGTYRYIVAGDPLITRDYLLWLQRRHPESKIFFFYANLVGNARHIPPKDIPQGIQIWTYDGADAEKYGIKLNPRLFITPDAKVKQAPIDYDAVFIGRDKGRMEYLKQLQSLMQEAGLRTYFHIVKNGRFSLPKKDYRRELAYSEILSYVARTRAIINIVYQNQKGMSVRDMEAAVNAKKLITNNAAAKSFGFYHPDNVFILTERDIRELPEFLDRPYQAVSAEFLERNSLFGWLKVILGYEEN